MYCVLQVAGHGPDAVGIDLPVLAVAGVKRGDDARVLGAVFHRMPKMLDGRGIFSPDKARFRRNTLCIARKRNAVAGGRWK